jgi:hypothetical protein
MNKEYSFSNLENFPNEILKIDSFVPARCKGRKSKHVENNSIVSFLKEFHNKINIIFPFILIHRDKPDFLIVSKKNKIGIEVTECIPKQLAQGLNLLDKNFQDNSKFEPEFFSWNSPKRKESEIIEIIKKSQNGLIGQGGRGKSKEGNWISGIKSCIDRKTEKLNNPGFDTFEYNYLLIYDNQPKAGLDIDFISAYLLFFFKIYCDKGNTIKYDKIFIDHDNLFLVIDKDLATYIKIVIKSIG